MLTSVHNRLRYLIAITLEMPADIVYLKFSAAIGIYTNDMIMRKWIPVLWSVLLSPVFLPLSTLGNEGDKPAIIPQPLHLTTGKGFFTITGKTQILFTSEGAGLEAVAKQLADGLREHTGLQLPVSELQPGKTKNAIILRLQADTLGEEGYHLMVNNAGVEIRATRPAGAFYASQTLYQLLPVEETAKVSVRVPAVTITDKPRFGWRGLMLDVGRYFYAVDYIKRYIDYLAMHKMNTFHWHLTEDHGWRIEIKKYPRLTSVGAWRKGTQYNNRDRINNTPHGGYYTQDQIREVVAYAQSKFVTIVPEIEMPGHSYAAQVAYPELSCTRQPSEMLVQWGIQKDIFCAGREHTFNFLEDVLSEIAALFPGEVIHIGGDEAPKNRWKACPDCQRRIKEEGLKDEHELQRYFITRIEKFMQTKGKRIIGWDEILEGGLAPNAIVMSWRGEAGGIAAAKMHHEVVMAPNHFMYLDYYQGEPYLEPYSIGGFLPLRRVYSYEPVPAELSTEQAQFIRGVQANIWCEYIHNPDHADYMTLPRAAAVAEVGWSAPENKDWEDFTRRMETQYRRYDRLGIHYAKSAYNVSIKVEKDPSGISARVSLDNDAYHSDIHYTTDGAEPTATSPRYERPFTVGVPSTIKAATFKDGKRFHKVSNHAVVADQQANR